MINYVLATQFYRKLKGCRALGLSLQHEMHSIDNIILVYGSHITNHLIAGKVFGKISKFNI